MKKNVLLITDIHGNLPALEAVLDDVKEIEFEAILCNGDIIYGAKPNECLERLIDLNAIMIAGNAESNVIKYASKMLPKYWYECKQFEFTRHIAKILKENNLLNLYNLPEQLVIENLLPGTIKMVHGSPDNQYEWISPDKNDGRYEEIMNSLEEDIIIFGHTHKQWNQKFKRKIAINSGSVGLPLDGEPKAQYSIIKYYEDNFDSIEIRQNSVDYDKNQAYLNFIKSGFAQEDPTIKLHKELLNTGIKRVIPFVDFYLNLIIKETGKAVDDLSIEDRNKYWDIADQTYTWKKN